jgi:N-acyl-D-amino-acid deacylase
MYPLDYGASIITVVLPDWYQAMAQQDRRSLGTRLRLALMVHISRRLVGFDFSDICIAYGGERQKDIIGKTVAEIARERGVPPLRAYLDVCEASDFKASVLMGAYQNDEIVRNLMNSDLSLFMTDAWVEPQGKQNGAIYGALPLFVEKAIAMGWPVERAIAKMTGLSASRFKLAECGLIREGYFADLNVIDLPHLKNRIETEQPPLGLTYTFINGTIAAQNGRRIAPDHPAGRAVRVGYPIGRLSR